MSTRQKAAIWSARSRYGDAPPLQSIADAAGVAVAAILSLAGTGEGEISVQSAGAAGIWPGKGWGRGGGAGDLAPRGLGRGDPGGAAALPGAEIAVSGRATLSDNDDGDRAGGREGAGAGGGHRWLLSI